MGGLRKKIPMTFADHAVRRGRDRRRAAVLPDSSARTRSCSPPIITRPWMYWVGVITAGMTAFYVFRAMFLTFFGELRGQGAVDVTVTATTITPARHACRTNRRCMLDPLVILACSLVGGLLSTFRTSSSRCFPLPKGEHDAMAE